MDQPASRMILDTVDPAETPLQDIDTLLVYRRICSFAGYSWHPI
jgi:hypothetical protein